MVANYYRYDAITTNISKGIDGFREGIQIGDSTLLNMYGFKVIAGDMKTALDAPYKIIITADKAIKYFGKTDVIGQTLTVENFSGSKHDFTITAVLETPPQNSVTQLADDYINSFFMSDNNLDFFGRNMSWYNPHIAGYIELQKGVTPQQIQKPMEQLVKKNAWPQTAADMKPYLVALPDYYLNANNELVKKMLYALSAIALFILLMAIVNFINMSVSKSATRMKEIGIRKVLGSLKKQLIAQFLIESVLIVLLATFLAFILFIATRNSFSSLVGKRIPSLTGFPLYFIAFPFLLVLFIGLIAGLYPAFVLSALKSVDSLKGKLASIKENVLMRKALITFQFATAAVVLIGAFIISKQINFFLSKNLGYDKEYIVSAQLPRDWTPAGVQKMESIRNQFAGMPQVKGATLSFEIPDGNNSGQTSIYRTGTDSTSALSTQILSTDENYTNVYKIPMKAGSFFEGHARDSGKIVLNESAVHALGFANTTSAIGQMVKIPGDPTMFEVKGVTNDFHFGSMQQKVSPLAFFSVEYQPIYRFLSFKIQPGNLADNVKAIQQKWSALLPGTSFEYKFMDDTLANLYKTEIQLQKASYTATVLALIIVLLGVLGLISLSIQKRTREIGIRKVLGSSVTGIMYLFIKEFLWMIIVGSAVACPLAYLLIHNWLQGYAYRIDINAVPFLISIICLGLITILLICLQTIKTAVANPVNSIRTE